MMHENVLVEEELSETTIEDLLGHENKLVVFNDSVNSFEYVEECFVQYLKHTPEQAQQCAIIIHNKGKCSVKEGSFDSLKPFKEALDDAGLTTEIQ
jgi:ATP-dependent Clp protease adaptor protein ClpS